MDKNKMNAKKPAGKNFSISNDMSQEVSSEFENTKRADADKNKSTSYSSNSSNDFIKNSQNKSNERISNEKNNPNKTI